MSHHMVVAQCTGVKNLDDIIHWACCNGNGLHFGEGKGTNWGGPEMGWKWKAKNKL